MQTGPWLKEKKNRKGGREWPADPGGLGHRRRARGGETGRGDRGEPLGRLGEVWVERRRLVGGEQRSPADMLIDGSAPAVDWQEGGTSVLLWNKAKLLGWLGGA